MRGIYCPALFVIFLFGISTQQARGPRRYIDAGVIQHHGTSSTVLSNSPRPLFQAIEAVREEYGWTVDFEDPKFFSSYDLYDCTDPAWRANHPTEPSSYCSKGGSFQSVYPEALDMANPTNEEAVLNNIVADYNKSGYPGKFVVRKESDGRYSIVGQSVRDNDGQDRLVTNILDTPLSISSQTRGAAETVQLILHQVAASTGVAMDLFTIVDNSPVVIGGTDVPARVLLRRTLDAAGAGRRIFLWDFLYSPSTHPIYGLNIRPTSLVHISHTGSRQLWPIDPSKKVIPTPLKQ